MREIKFRAWCPIKKEMYEPFTLWKAILENNVFVHKYKDILMQYTGLKDKNGKEIYEGDILRINNNNYDPDYESFFVGICMVSWKGVSFSFDIIKNDMKIPQALDSSGMWHIGEGDTTEIIGNIYENPELLTK